MAENPYMLTPEEQLLYAAQDPAHPFIDPQVVSTPIEFALNPQKYGYRNLAEAGVDVLSRAGEQAAPYILYNMSPGGVPVTASRNIAADWQNPYMSGLEKSANTLTNLLGVAMTAAPSQMGQAGASALNAIGQKAGTYADELAPIMKNVAKSEVGGIGNREKVRFNEVGGTRSDADYARLDKVYKDLEERDPSLFKNMYSPEKGSNLEHNWIDLSEGKDFLVQQPMSDVTVLHYIPDDYIGKTNVQGLFNISSRHSIPTWQQSIKNTGSKYVYVFGDLDTISGDKLSNIPGYKMKYIGRGHGMEDIHLFERTSGTPAIHRTTPQAAESILKNGFDLERFGTGANAASDEPLGVFLSRSEGEDFANEVSRRGLPMTSTLNVEISPDAKIVQVDDKTRRLFAQQSEIEYLMKHYGIPGEEALMLRKGGSSIASNPKLMSIDKDYLTNPNVQKGIAKTLANAYKKTFGADGIEYQEPFHKVMQTVVFDPDMVKPISSATKTE